MLLRAALKAIRSPKVPCSTRRLLASCASEKSSDQPLQPGTYRCWKCGSLICHDCALFCDSPSCQTIQKLEITECNFFCLFGIEEKFRIDEVKLEAKFKNLQRLMHPDKFAMKSSEERERSSHNSSIVNQAYQLMKSPLERISYLMAFHGLDVVEQGKSFSDPSLMNEMFELAETADELSGDGEKGQEAVSAMLCDIERSVERISVEIQEHYDEGDFVSVSKAAVKLNYLINVKDTLKEKLIQI